MGGEDGLDVMDTKVAYVAARSGQAKMLKLVVRN